ncbi:MAG: T9SS type A sorting domain-containing protein [Weeksellaceae bacterium]|nr:T9SS type A sorting domain-containing protein [Weeksellaceae bacterium]
MKRLLLLFYLLVFAQLAFGLEPTYNSDFLNNENLVVSEIYHSFIKIDDTEVSTDNPNALTVGKDRNSGRESVLGVQNVFIPDANFKTYLIANFDTDSDGEISYTEAAAVTGAISISNKNIADLTGIEAFINITELLCFQNQLTSLDLSQNTQLWRVNARNNQLTSVDFGANTALTQISVESNNLSGLNVQNGNNTNITYFFAYNNSNLYCIQVDNVAISNANWTGSNYNFDSHASFNTNCSPQYQITVTANPSTAGTITGGGLHYSGDTATLTATPTIAYQFVRWTENGTEVSTANPYIFTANANRTLVAEFAPILNVNDVNTITLNVYPNPVSTILNVEVKESTNIKIINLLGVTVVTQKLNAGNNTIDVSNLEKGVYFLRTDKGKTVKFIKK